MKLKEAIGSIGETVIYVEGYAAIADAEIGSIRGLSDHFVFVQFNNSPGTAKACAPRDLFFYERPLLPQIADWIDENDGKNAGGNPDTNQDLAIRDQ